MRGRLRKLLCILLVLGMFLQDSQALAVYAAEELTELADQPNRELMELKEGVTEDMLPEQAGLGAGSSQETGAPDQAEEPDQEQAPDQAGEPDGTADPEATQPLEPGAAEGTEGTEPLREPESYEPEAEDAEGTLVHFDEESRTYYLGERKYRTVFGNSSTYLDADGQVQLIDNTLAEIPEAGVMAALEDGEDAGQKENTVPEETAVYGNTANSYQVLIPEVLREGQGIVLSRDGWQMELVPIGGDYSRSVTKDNMILYNDVYPGTDVQYSVLDNSVKEDIILREPGQAVYQYALYAEGLTASQEEAGGPILLSDEKETRCSP